MPVLNRFHFQKTLSTLYPQCSVHLYGSTVNGLGFKGSDIDAYVDLGMCILSTFVMVLSKAACLC